MANSVIANNKGRKPKQLWTSNRTGEPVCCYEAVDERDEARFVLAMTARLRQAEETQYRDCAVFYRTRQSRSFEEECIRSNVPYRIFGGIRFYERKEIKDILAYLRLVSNPNDNISLRRILNVPRRGSGDGPVPGGTDRPGEGREPGRGAGSPCVAGRSGPHRYSNPGLLRQ